LVVVPLLKLPRVRPPKLDVPPVLKLVPPIVVGRVCPPRVEPAVKVLVGLKAVREPPRLVERPVERPVWAEAALTRRENITEDFEDGR
jgi:hypothetical protein